MDALDIWMMESIKTYKELLMFNLQQPTSVIEWMHADAICVAGNSSTSTNEILELGLPAKLLMDPDASGIHKDRDFDVRSGGFCDHAVHALQSFPEERLIATTSFQKSKVIISKVGEAGCDLIQEVSNINLESNTSIGGRLSMARRPSQKAHLAVATACCNLCITDIISQKEIYKAEGNEEELCGVKFLDTNTLIVSTNTRGSFQIIDVRINGGECSLSCTPRDESKRKQTGHIALLEDNLDVEYNNTTTVSKTTDLKQCKKITLEQSNLNFRFDVADCRGRCVESDHPIVQLDANGHLNVMDLRNLTTPCKSWKLDALSTSSPYLEVKFDPNNSQLISVSGFDNKVYIFDLRNADTSISLKPVFVHSGHMNSYLVLSHTWHPTVQDLVLSSDSEGALHAWKWNRHSEL